MATREAAFAHPSPTDKGSTTWFQLCQPGVCCWEPSSGGFGEERAFNEGFASSGFFLCFGEHPAQLCTLSLCLPFLCKVPLFKQARDICPHPAVSSPPHPCPQCFLVLLPSRAAWQEGGHGALRASPNFYPFQALFSPSLSLHSGAEGPAPRQATAAPSQPCRPCQARWDPGATTLLWGLPG